MADHLLHDLDEAQTRAVTSPARPLAILAPAGSGKTRVLTRRIAWRVESGDADASHVLALTFTRRAAGELAARLRALGLRGGVATGTFHGVAYAQLRSRWADEGRAAPGLLARKSRLLAGLVAGTPISVAQLAGEIEWAKARLVGPDGYAEAGAAARRRVPVPADRVADLYRRYEDDKRRARMVDFDDLLRLCGHLIETDPAFAAAQRWRFQHLFVDEFQDVNPLQLRLLDAWRGDRYDLCVVGDPHQAIYGWNGADAGLLEGFRRLYPPAEVIALDGNYRSTPQVLEAATDVLRRADVGDRPVRATRVGGPAVRLERHPDERSEAVAIARAARDRRGPRSRWSAQAVLVRTHAQIPVITDALRLAGVPYRVRGGDGLLDHKDVREALDLLRRSGGRLAACLPDVAAVGDGAGPVDTVVQLAHDHLRLDPGASSSGFVAWLVATVQAEGADEGADAVTVATFHAAKGLEWPVVHLAGLEDGLVPLAHARTVAQRREEARLLYVAMTRAEDELRCTWAAERTRAGRPAERRLTPWLGGLAERGQRQADDDAGPPVTDWRRHLAEQRAVLASATPAPAPEPAASPALAALWTWRDEHARAARVEPAALVDDRLLEAIAERRPATRDELVAVPGMGPVLAARVGDGLLAALRAPCGRAELRGTRTVDFTVDQVYAAGGDAVARAYASPDLYAELVGLPKLGTPEVLDCEVDGTTVRLQIRYRFVGDLSAAVTAVVDPRKLSWVEHSVHDLAARRMTYRLAPDHYADRLSSSGTCAITDRAHGSVRTVTGRLKVKALVVGSAVERAIVSGLREHLVDEAPVVDRYVADHTG